jgi:drug/metabolite transporter (DMT)-like permease
VHPRPATGLHGWAAGAASTLAYGSMAVVAVFAFSSGASPTVLLTLRGVFAGVAIGALWVFTGRVRRMPLKAAAGLMLFCGIVFGAQVVAFFVAVDRGGAQLPVVVVNVCPLMVIGLVWLRDRTPVPLILILLTLVTIVGLVFVAGAGTGTASLSAVGLTLLSAAGYAVYLVTSERWVHQVGTVASAGLVTIGSTATIAVFALVNGDTFAVSAPVWHTAMLQGLILTPIGMGGAMYAVRSLGPIPLSLLGALEPVIGLTLAAILLHESLAPLQWVGVVIIVAACTAVPLVTRRQPATQSVLSAPGVGEVAVLESYPAADVWFWSPPTTPPAMGAQCTGSGRSIPDGPPPAVPMQCPECGRNVRVESTPDGVIIAAHPPGVDGN